MCMICTSANSPGLADVDVTTCISQGKKSNPLEESPLPGTGRSTKPHRPPDRFPVYRLQHYDQCNIASTV